jgi:hypothetical protein
VPGVSNGWAWRLSIASGNDRGSKWRMLIFPKCAWVFCVRNGAKRLIARSPCAQSRVLAPQPRQLHVLPARSRKSPDHPSDMPHSSLTRPLIERLYLVSLFDGRRLLSFVLPQIATAIGRASNGESTLQCVCPDQGNVRSGSRGSFVVVDAEPMRAPSSLDIRQSGIAKPLAI